MKAFPLALFILMAVMSCVNHPKETTEDRQSQICGTPIERLYSFCSDTSAYNPGENVRPIEQLRDTLIGKFNGKTLDMLICEPIDTPSPSSDEYDPYGGQHYKWRIYTSKGTVKSLIIENTIGIRFIKEGDLDGNGTDEWGYVTQWPTSNWMNYHAYTARNGKWELLTEPSVIWLGHLETSYDDAIEETEIARRSNVAGYVNIRFSDIRNDGADFLLIDTLLPIIKH